MARALSRACKLFGTSTAAVQPTRNPGTDPARLGSTACASASLMALPTASTVHPNECAPTTAQSAAADNVFCPRYARALEAHRTGPIGPSGAAHAPLFDAIATRCSTASPKPAGSSWWFSAFNRRLRVDLERSTPKSSIPSPIMTVTSTPPWRDHLALIVTARTPPASGCTDARQWVEQKRSTVQRRSALSTALRSAIACAMSAGVANAGAEGALIAIRPSFPARN